MGEPRDPDKLLEATLNEMEQVYCSSNIPWVVGFSGGKDSSTVVQLSYLMLRRLMPEKRTKQVHVIASDTGVESPVVAEFIDKMLASLSEGAMREGLPLVAGKVVPELNDTFWVNLLGKGYPSPNRFFRWCTERLKINPATKYIQGQIDEFGSAIILLGARKSESASRAQVLENHRIEGSRLRTHATMPQAFVYAPISDWTTEDVWQYLMTNPTPWDGMSGLNIILRNLYRDAAGECPLVIDTTTPSCGQSRFGCWTCTVVNTDTSMEGFVETGGQYAWMEKLLGFRNKLKAYRDDLTKRESWRRNDPSRPRGWAVELGQLHLDGEPESSDDASQTAGPFRLEVRQELLRELLEIQKVTGYTLIQEEELDLIRRYWTEDYRVDSLALIEIMEAVYGPAARREQLVGERRLLESVCAEHSVDVLAVDRLLDLERGYVTKLRKRGLLNSIDEVIRDLTEREAKRS